MARCRKYSITLIENQIKEGQTQRKVKQSLTSLERFMPGKIEEDDLDEAFVDTCHFYFKHFYAGSSARYMLDYSIAGIKCDFSKAIETKVEKSYDGVCRELKSRAMSCRSWCQE